MLYLFFKWLHLIAVISWMCGILYGYRLLVYLAERGDDAKVRETLVLMANRLYRIITMPGMGIGILAGGAMLLSNPTLFHQGWVHVKLTAIVAMVGASIYGKRLLVRFETRAANVPSSKTLRILNEVPTLLLMVIVAMAVFRPF